MSTPEQSKALQRYPEAQATLVPDPATAALMHMILGGDNSTADMILMWPERYDKATVEWAKKIKGISTN